MFFIRNVMKAFSILHICNVFWFLTITNLLLGMTMLYGLCYDYNKLYLFLQGFALGNLTQNDYVEKAISVSWSYKRKEYLHLKYFGLFSSWSKWDILLNENKCCVI